MFSILRIQSSLIFFFYFCTPTLFILKTVNKINLSPFFKPFTANVDFCSISINNRYMLYSSEKKKSLGPSRNKNMFFFPRLSITLYLSLVPFSLIYTISPRPSLFSSSLSISSKYSFVFRASIHINQFAIFEEIRFSRKFRNGQIHRHALWDIPDIFVFFGAAITVLVNEGGKFIYPVL